MDQWATGNIEGSGKGWLAEISDSIKNENYLLSLGPTSSMALEGGMSKSLHFTENKNLIMREINYKNKEILYKRELLKKYVSTENYSTNEILRIKNNINKLPPNIQIPKGNFSKQIALALKTFSIQKYCAKYLWGGGRSGE